MLKERLLGVITTLPSRASHPMTQCLALYRLLELRERTRAMGVESVPNGTYHLADVFLDANSHPYVMLSQLSPDDCQSRREKEISL
jgi:hypothetical protein